MTNLLTILTAAATDSSNILPDLGEKLTLMGALAFFLYYFMKELKAVRTQMDAYREESEKKIEAMFERVIKAEEQSRTLIDKNNEAMDRLTDAVDALKNHLKT